ncbi:MAG: hypothetical protein AAFQ66_22215 [Pseudomonadota bacterium]
MPRRSIPPKARDESAFPVRIRFRVPGTGLGTRLTDLNAWLVREIGPTRYAVHSSPGRGMNGLGVYLVTVEDAERVVRAFPDLLLADGTVFQPEPKSPKP